MNFSNLHIAFSCMAALEHNFDICWLILSWLSISICSNFTDLVASISLFYILWVIWFSFLLFIIIAWNLSESAIILLFLNQSSTDSDSFSSVWRRLLQVIVNYCKLLQETEMVLPSAKLCKSDFVRHENKSFITMLNRIGPSIGILWYIRK